MTSTWKKHVGGALVVLAGWCTSAQAIDFKTSMIQFDPWTMPDPANPTKFIGIVPEVMAEIEKRTGHKIVGTMTPYARVENDLKEGNIDFSLMAWGDQRAEWANKGAVAFPLKFGVIATKGTSIKAYADLKGVKISVPRGLKVDVKFDEDTTLTKDLDLDYTTGVKKAEAGRVNAVAGSIETILTIATGLGVRDKFGEELVLRTADASISYSKKAPNIAQAAVINDAITKMVADGTMAKIRDKWLKK
jgi:polar amino acid transport system substrate-binding protein